MDQFCQCCNTHLLQQELFLSPCSCTTSLPVSNPFTQPRLPSPSPSLTLPPNIPAHDQLASIEDSGLHGIQGPYDAEAIMRDFPTNPDMDRGMDNNETALTIAAAGGHDDLVQLLIERKADIEHKDKKGQTPLLLASYQGHDSTVRILLENGADIEAQSDRTKDTALAVACSAGRLDVVDILVARSANLEHRNLSDYTPLSLAASGGHTAIIRLLLDHGADINSRSGSKLGISPLMLASMNGHVQAVQLLLERGSDVNAQIETNRNTALTLACFQGKHEVVTLLLDRKANLEHRAKTGLTPLMEAATGGHYEVGRLLLDHEADVNAPPVPSSKDTALTIAADKGHARFVDLLVTRGADIEVKNKKGNSPLWLACHGGHLEVIKIMVQSLVDVNSMDNRKVSCLMIAFRRGHLHVTSYLVLQVTQFPCDSDCLKHLNSLLDRPDQRSRCKECFEVIMRAKERQTEEANKHASILLHEIDLEKQQEENRRAQAAKKRAKKKKQKEKKKLSFVSSEEALAEGDRDSESFTESYSEHRDEGTPQHFLESKGVDLRSRSSSSDDPTSPLAEFSSSTPLSERKKSAPSLLLRSDSPAPDKPRRKSKPSSSSSNTSGPPTPTDPAPLLESETDQSLPSPRRPRKEEGWKEVVKKSKKITIQSDAVSRVIGRAGYNINAVREASKAHIELDKNARPGLNATITIRGSADATKLANKYITALVNDAHATIADILPKGSYKKTEATRGPSATTGSPLTSQPTPESQPPNPAPPRSRQGLLPTPKNQGLLPAPGYFSGASYSSSAAKPAPVPPAATGWKQGPLQDVPAGSKPKISPASLPPVKPSLQAVPAIKPGSVPAKATLDSKQRSVPAPLVDRSKETPSQPQTSPDTSKSPSAPFLSPTETQPLQPQWKSKSTPPPSSTSATSDTLCNLPVIPVALGTSLTYPDHTHSSDTQNDRWHLDTDTESDINTDSLQNPITRDISPIGPPTKKSVPLPLVLPQQKEELVPMKEHQVPAKARPVEPWKRDLSLGMEEPRGPFLPTPVTSAPQQYPGRINPLVAMEQSRFPLPFDLPPVSNLSADCPTFIPSEHVLIQAQSLASDNLILPNIPTGPAMLPPAPEMQDAIHTFVMNPHQPQVHPQLHVPPPHPMQDMLPGPRLHVMEVPYQPPHEQIAMQARRRESYNPGSEQSHFIKPESLWTDAYGYNEFNRGADSGDDMPTYFLPQGITNDKTMDEPVPREEPFPVGNSTGMKRIPGPIGAERKEKIQIHKRTSSLPNNLPSMRPVDGVQEGQGDQSGSESETGEESQMGVLLVALGLGGYASLFEKHEIDESALLLMTDGDFAEIGLPEDAIYILKEAVSPCEGENTRRALLSSET